MIESAKIELVRREHMEQVVNLLQYISHFTPSKESYDDIFEAFKAQSHVISLVATDNNKVVGYGAVTFEINIRGGKMGHVENIVICKSYQHKGIGTELVNTLYEIAKQNGCYKVALQCTDHNVLFYKKCSYKVNGVAMQRLIMP